MAYKAVFIDWDGTLSDSRFWERWEHDPKRSVQYTLLQDALFSSSEGVSLVNQWMIGQKSHRDILHFAVTKTGVPYDELESGLRYSAETMKFIDVDAPNLIKRLQSKGVRVLIATDNMDTFRYWTIPALSLTSLFDGILASDELGALKSDVSSNEHSKFFGDYLSNGSIKPGEAALIDNSLNNKPVEQYGIKFLHVNETTSASDHIKDILKNFH